MSKQSRVEGLTAAEVVNENTKHRSTNNKLFIEACMVIGEQRNFKRMLLLNCNAFSLSLSSTHRVADLA